MNKNKETLAQGYRTPKLDFKDLFKSILTLGFKQSNDVKEAAKTYLYIIEDKHIRILQENLHGKNEEIARKTLESHKERQAILSKGSFVEGPYVYHLDKETID